MGARRTNRGRKIVTASSPMRGPQALGGQVMDLLESIRLRVGEDDAPQEVGDVPHVVDPAEAEAADGVGVNVQTLVP